MAHNNNSQQTHPIFQLTDVTKVYTTGAGDFTALDKVNIDIYPGEFLGIIGKSGAGKSTLLSMLSGVSRISSGEVVYTDPADSTHQSTHPIHALDQNQLATWRGKHVGVVYQSFELLPMLSLVDNVVLPQDFAGIFQRRKSRQKARELLEAVEIGEHSHKIPAHISGGQKQRVAIARALVNDPQVIVADEPTGSLDTKTSDRIFGIFEKLVAQGKTVIMVTHDMNLADRFDRVLYITDGVVTEPELDENGKIKAIGQYAAESEEDTEAENLKDITLEPVFGQNEAVKNEVAISLKDVVKTYRGPAGEFTALKGINLDFNYGDFVAIVGKSGSGKSTLLNMLTGIDHPSTGEVTIGGEKIYDMGESQRAQWRGKNIGIVFQFFQLLPTLTLLENIMLPMDYGNVFERSERPARAMELLKMVGLEKEARKLPDALSTGQQQSAAIARSMATDPAIIVADEPTGNLDSKSANKIINLFNKLSADGKTILIVTHDPGLTRFTHRTVTLADGLVVNQEDEPELSISSDLQPAINEQHALVAGD
ncbi:MAG: putative ABC transport system ATP-binding protein [Cellvibrionaceae bacterium]|jgi:putative ABC transport system ATP-binding protein